MAWTFFSTSRVREATTQSAKRTGSGLVPIHHKLPTLGGKVLRPWLYIVLSVCLFTPCVPFSIFVSWNRMTACLLYSSFGSPASSDMQPTTHGVVPVEKCTRFKLESCHPPGDLDLTATNSFGLACFKEQTLSCICFVNLYNFGLFHCKYSLHWWIIVDGVF